MCARHCSDPFARSGARQAGCECTFSSLHAFAPSCCYDSCLPVAVAVHLFPLPYSSGVHVQPACPHFPVTGLWAVSGSCCWEQHCSVRSRNISCAGVYIGTQTLRGESEGVGFATSSGDARLFPQVDASSVPGPPQASVSPCIR